MNRVVDFLEAFISIVIALCRLFFLTCAMVSSAIHIILFSETEIYNIEMKGMPLRHQRKKDMQNLAFVDSLMINNQDLLDYADEDMRKNGELPPEDDDDEGI